MKKVVSKNKNDLCNDYMILGARLFIALTFALSVWGKFTGFSGKAMFAESSWISFGIIPGELLILVAIVMEVFGVVALVSGWKMKEGAQVLAVYTLLTIIMFHYSNFNSIASHLLMIGGLLALSLNKPGKFAL